MRVSNMAAASLVIVAVTSSTCGGNERAPSAPPEPAPEPVAAPEPEPEPPPPGDPVPERVEMLVLGSSHGCRLTADGEVLCWGGDQFAQLGDASVARGWAASRPRPRPVGGLDDPVRLAGGSFHTCALLADGSVRCWGHGGFGQLGDGGTEDRAEPVAVEGLGRAVAIDAGERHGCARLATGELECWGDNGFGQIGDGTREARPHPVEVPVEGAVEPCLGRHHTCARLADGTVSCWGAAFEGQLGDGDAHLPDGLSPSPVAVPGLADVRALSCGATHNCALLGDGTLRCWGRNDAGQLGTHARRAIVRAPAEVEGVTGVVTVAAGAAHTCAQKRSGEIVCWGANAHGQLGDGTRDPRRTPIVIPDLSGAGLLAVGANFSCVTSAAAIRCWGSNAKGQLGDGTDVIRPSPVEVGVMAPRPAPSRVDDSAD